MFDININDIIIIAVSVFGGYSLPQPAWAKWITDLIKEKFFTKKDAE
jgi:hypothetical protein